MRTIRSVRIERAYRNDLDAMNQRNALATAANNRFRLIVRMRKHTTGCDSGGVTLACNVALVKMRCGWDRPQCAQASAGSEESSAAQSRKSDIVDTFYQNEHAYMTVNEYVGGKHMRYNART
jgi:hypothetical protein